MKIQLAPEEVEELRRIQKKERFHRRRFIKATVLLMLHQGVSVDVICASLPLDENTVYRYAKAFREKGLEAYLVDKYVRYEGKLTQEQEQQLVAHLEANLYPDCKSVCAWVEQEFGVKFSISGMRDLLHRLEFVYKKTKAVPAKAEVYFTDGTHPTHNTGGMRGGIRAGKDFAKPSNSGHRRVNINAAVRAIKPEHVVYDIADTINAQSMQRLCRKLLKKHPGKKIYVICDNAGYNRCAWLRQWAENQRIEFVYLHPYPPNLNLIERLWRFLKKEAISSIYYDTYDKFREGIVFFLDNIKDYKKELRSLLTLNFRTVGNTSVYFSQTTS